MCSSTGAVLLSQLRLLFLVERNIFDPQKTQDNSTLGVIYMDLSTSTPKRFLVLIWPRDRVFEEYQTYRDADTGEREMDRDAVVVA